MSSITIKQSQEQDVDAVFGLVSDLKPLTQHTSYTYWNLFRNFADSCFIATDQEEPIGFITSHPTTTPAGEWFIWQVGIIPKYRGTELINKLQDSVVDVALRSGAVAINTSIETDNPRSLGAFSSMATRLDSTLEQIEQFNLTPSDPSVATEVLYRISLDKYSQ